MCDVMGDGQKKDTVSDQAMKLVDRWIAVRWQQRKICARETELLQEIGVVREKDAASQLTNIINNFESRDRFIASQSVLLCCQLVDAVSFDWRIQG